MCSDGIDIVRIPAASPRSNEIIRLASIVLTLVPLRYFCAAAITEANRAAAAPSAMLPPKNTAKPAAARMLPARIAAYSLCPSAT